MQMGNKEVQCTLLLQLKQLGFSLEVREESSEVLISTSGLSLQNDALRLALEIVANLGADEVWVEDGRLRLWWD